MVREVSSVAVRSKSSGREPRPPTLGRRALDTERSPLAVAPERPPPSVFLLSVKNRSINCCPNCSRPALFGGG